MITDDGNCSAEVKMLCLIIFPARQGRPGG